VIAGDALAMQREPDTPLEAIGLSLLDPFPAPAGAGRNIVIETARFDQSPG
jgi:hypothetical protein